LTITGTNFDGGNVAVTFSGTGISAVGNPTFTPASTTQPETLTQPVTISGTAPAGAQNVIVTDKTSGKSGSCSNCFTVDAQPTITGVSPGSAKQGATTDVVITGTNFISGATSDFGAGITVNSTTFTDSQHLKANISVGNAATVGARDVKVDNHDGGSVTCPNCFGVTAGP
jgi:hypothetical protein